MRTTARIALAGILVASMAAAGPAAAQTACTDLASVMCPEPTLPPGTGLPSPLPAPSPAPPSPPEGAESGGMLGRAVNAWIGGLVTSGLRPVMESLGRAVFTTPDLSSHPRIRQFFKVSLGIANALLVLFLLAGAALIAAGGVEARLQGKEVVQRVVLAAGAANLSLHVMRWATEISNAAAVAFLRAEGEVGVERLLSLVLPDSPFEALLALGVLVAGVGVLFSWVVRVAVLALATAGAPIALVAYALPHSDSWARCWWRAVAALLAAPVAQALLYALGFWVFLSAEPLLGGIGVGFLDTLVLGVLLFLLYKIPLWALRSCAAPAHRALASTRSAVGVGIDLLAFGAGAAVPGMAGKALRLWRARSGAGAARARSSAGGGGSP